jgi:glucose/mannose-6-phosphate isomerase
MDLDKLERMREIDTQGYIDHLNDLPDQLAIALELGQTLELPEPSSGIDQILIAGMGGSAIGADLVAAYAKPDSRVPIVAHRNYELPRWAHSANTLVICSSHSGNTEEVLSIFEQAASSDCQVMAVTTGGQLAEKARAHGYPVWQFEHDFQPRAAVGYSFGLLAGILSRLEIGVSLPDDVKSFAAGLKSHQANHLPEKPVVQNPAKRMAGQLIGRWITVWGAGILAPIARRWKGQFNEVSKAQASFEILPEGDHNTLQGVAQPEGQFGASMHIFLQAESLHPRNQLRVEFTRMGFMTEGHNADIVIARGEGRLAQMWNTLIFGDYVAYYLAMAYEVDPSPVPMLVELKEQLSKA